MIYKRRRKTEAPLPQREYDSVLRFVTDFPGWQESLQDKLYLLDYVMEVVRRDMEYHCLTDILYRYPNFPFELDGLFPYSVYDEKGNAIDIAEEECNKSHLADLSQECVVVVPWESSRMSSAISSVFRDGFGYEPSNHFGYYYEEMDICYFESGNHHVAAALAKKHGWAILKKYHTALAFPHVTTDGKKWYNKHTKMELRPVRDFRMAILYELARQKYELQRGVPDLS